VIPATSVGLPRFDGFELSRRGLEKRVFRSAELHSFVFGIEAPGTETAGS